jgi:hypothetical protein
MAIPLNLFLTLYYINELKGLSAALSILIKELSLSAINALPLSLLILTA